MSIFNFPPTNAASASYDNTESGLTASDVQGAIDELAENGGAVQTAVASVELQGNADLFYCKTGRIATIEITPGDVTVVNNEVLWAGIVPVGYRPLNIQFIPASVSLDGATTYVTGLCCILANGDITFYGENYASPVTDEDFYWDGITVNYITPA